MPAAAGTDHTGSAGRRPRLRGRTGRSAAAVGGEGFRLDEDAPFRAHLLPLGPEEHVLLLVLHHIAADGWSLDPLLLDLAAACRARMEGREPGWAPLPLQYADYCAWQHDLLGDASASDQDRQLAHWREALAGLPDELPLPTDRPRPARATHHGGDIPVRLDADLHRRLRAVATETGTTVFMVVQAGLAALLTRLGAGTDIPLGTPVAGRADELLDDLVGCFVNTLVLRTDTSGDPSFRELLSRVRETDLAAYAHQELPFEHLVEALNPPRSLARHPLFQVMLAFRPTAGPRLDLPGLHGRTLPVETGSTKIDLTFNLGEQRTPTALRTASRASSSTAPTSSTGVPPWNWPPVWNACCGPRPVNPIAPSVPSTSSGTANATACWPSSTTRHGRYRTPPSPGSSRRALPKCRTPSRPRTARTA